jgi:hypothetical protein
MLLTAVGCGPVYKTTYNYRAPKTALGRDCVRNCEVRKDLCEERARLDTDRCQVDAQRTYQECLSRARKKEDRSACYVPYCSSPSTDGCVQDYNRCFEVCGGKVTPHTVCVANCPVPE